MTERMEELLKELKAANLNLARTFTPERIEQMDGLQAAWCLEQLEHLRYEAEKLRRQIQKEILQHD